MRRRRLVVPMAAGDTEYVDMELTGPVTVSGFAWSDPEADPHPEEPPVEGRQIRFTVDKPPALGGLDGGMMPSEHLLAAVGSCTLMTARRIAEKRKVAWSSLRCRAVAHLEGSDIARIELALTVGSDGTKKDWETVFRLAEKTCTISRALSCPVTHTIAVTETDPKADA